MQTPDFINLLASLKNDARAQAGGVVRRLIDAEAVVSTFIAATAPDGSLGVLIRVDNHLVPRPNEFPGGGGFAIRTEVFREDDRGKSCFGIFCTDPAYDDVLVPFIQDVVPRLLGAKSDKLGVSIFLERIALWQRFFAEGQSSLLTLDGQAGLFGELLILRDLAVPSVGAAEAVEGWKGPEAAPQDFRLRNSAVEVKSTRAKAGYQIPIASEMQLDNRPFAHLVLAHIGLSLGGTGNPNLAELISEIRALLTAHGAVLDEFNSKLIRAGWLDAFAERYAANRFHVQEQRLFEIRNGFPRIIAGDFPAGVGQVTYRVELGLLHPFEVGQPIVEGWIKNG